MSTYKALNVTVSPKRKIYRGRGEGEEQSTMNQFTHTHTHTHTQHHKYTHTHTCTHARTHARTHTHTPVKKKRLLGRGKYVFRPHLKADVELE